MDLTLLERYALPDGTDCADREYLRKTALFAEQAKRGLITEREHLESVLVAHVEWVRT